MDRKHNKLLVPFARRLRKDMTKEERHLWYDFLRNYEIRFTRQKVLGKFIVDFYSAESKLVVEVDGSEHYRGRAIEKDERRTRYLEGYGIMVLRIPNNYVNKNFSGVCEYIDRIAKQRVNNHANRCQ